MKKEYQKIYDKIPEDKRTVADKLITELNFVDDTLSKLRTEVRNHGPIEKFEQGKQNFMRESPALSSYNKTMKSKLSIINNLIGLIPKNENKSAPVDDGFDSFVAGRLDDD